jgi:wyosine [tRNA(Phe)-imidazoG37] synthetase (radical SAM superfamily)
MTLPLLEHIVYGPVASRRLGRSLGVNLLPPGVKVCTMSCAYCQYGWTRRRRRRGPGARWPSPQSVEAAVETRLAKAAASNDLIDRITIAGHGEPTLHPAFGDVVDRMVATRDRIAPKLPIAVLSNSTTAMVADVQRGLERLDERYMKLDAGDPFTFARLNGSAFPMSSVIDGLRALPPSIIQAMFVTDERGDTDNTSEAVVSQWLDAVEAVRAAGVHIYTIDRAPALAILRPVTGTRLREIAEQVRHAGIPAEVFTAGRHAASST